MGRTVDSFICGAHGVTHDAQECGQRATGECKPLGWNIDVAAMLGETMTDVSKELLPLVEECEHGHKFGKLPDHPKRNGLDRCPHCMAQGLDAARAQPAPADVVEKRVEEAIRQSYLGNPFAKHLFRRLAKAALAAIPVSGEVERLREALGPLAAMRLSTEPTVSDCLYRSPATEARRRADEIEKRDADILRARQALTPPRSIRVSDLIDEEVEGMRK